MEKTFFKVWTVHHTGDTNVSTILHAHQSERGFTYNHTCQLHGTKGSLSFHFWDQVLPELNNILRALDSDSVNLLKFIKVDCIRWLSGHVAHTLRCCQVVLYKFKFKPDVDQMKK